MTKRSLIYTIITCAVLLAMQAVFLFLPGGVIPIFVQAIRPSVYGLLVLGVFLFTGRYSRPVKKAYQTNSVAFIALIMFASMIIACSYLFGGASNGMTSSFVAVMRSMWTAGVPLVLGEIVRFKLIKAAGSKNQLIVIVALSAVYAFVRLDDLRILMIDVDADMMQFLFASVLPALMVSSVVSFVAIQGSFLCVLLFSFVYNLGGTFSPVLPSFDRLVWSLVLCGLLFVVVVIYHYIVGAADGTQRKRAAQMAKYSKRDPVTYTVFLGIMGFIVAFFLQVFPIYPVVILTGSMTGTIDRGSMVVMRRIPVDEAILYIQEETILHYRFGNIEFVHRVIEFTYTIDGERQYITKGDANPFPDRLPVPQADVLGTPLFHIPLIGYPNVIFRAMFGGFFAVFYYNI